MNYQIQYENINHTFANVVVSKIMQKSPLLNREVTVGFYDGVGRVIWQRKPKKGSDIAATPCSPLLVSGRFAEIISKENYTGLTFNETIDNDNGNKLDWYWVNIKGEVAADEISYTKKEFDVCPVTGALQSKGAQTIPSGKVVLKKEPTTDFFRLSNFNILMFFVRQNVADRIRNSKLNNVRLIEL